MPGSTRVSLRLFGAPALIVHGASATPASPGAYAVLGRLALARGAAVERGSLGESLRPDLDRIDARAELRRQLYYIDTVFRERGVPSPVLRTGRTIALDPRAEVEVDIARFEGLAAEGGALEEAAALYAGDLLEGFDDEVIRRERDRLRALMATLLERIVGAHAAAGRTADAIAWARRLCAFEPYHENSVRALMRLQFDGGDRTGALRTYHDFARLLEDELDTTPLPQTVALASEIGESVTLPVRRTTLPRQTTSFVGREAEVEALLGAVETSRLVTIVGSPGVGKTRLAVRVAAALDERFAGGTFFVDLAGARDATSVERMLCEAAGADPREGEPLRFLVDRKVLIVLDNCEHVANACAVLAARALDASRELRIVATSRRALAVAGERIWRLAPLPVPAENATSEQIRASPAVQLFCDRVREARAESDAELPLETVAAISRTLEGIALALELAAARTRAIPLDELSGQLADRFRVLRADGKPPRGASLATAYAWSYGLLGRDARALLRRLATFAGRFSLDAALAVAGTRGLAASRWRAALDELVEHSLVEPPALAGGDDRFGTLHATREFARGRTSAREHRDARERHARYFLSVAMRRGAELEGSSRERAYPALLRDLDEIVSALAAAIVDEVDVPAGVAACVALQHLWTDVGRTAEASHFLQCGLEHAGLDGPLRAEALRVAAVLARRRRAVVPAIELGARAREEFAALGDAAGEARAIVALANALTLSGEPARAMSFGERGLALARSAGSLRIEALLSLMMAQAELSLARVGASRARYTRALALCEEARMVPETLIALNNLATCALFEGAADDAERYADESLRRGRELGLAVHVAWALSALASAAWAHDRIARGLALADEVAAAARAADLPVLVIRVLEDIACHFARTGRARDAAYVAGAADAARDHEGVPRLPVEQPAREGVTAAVVAAVGPTAYAAARAAGATLALEAALASARTAAATGVPV